MKNSFKKIFMTILSLTIFLSIGKQSIKASEYANPTNSNVSVDGKSISFEAYNINGFNYFKLRDIAMVLNNTKSKFNVKWDNSKNAINLITGENYEIVGGELEKSNIVTIKITENSSPIYKNGTQINLHAYNIGGNNYFKLRDMADSLSFNVAFDNNTGSVLINSGGVTTGSTEKPNDNNTQQPSTGSNLINDLDEYKLKIEYKDDDIEYKYDLDKDGSIDAEIDDEVNNKKTKGSEAGKFIESKLLNLDYSGTSNEIIERVLNSLGVSKDYKKIKLEIEYNSKSKLEIEIEKK